MFKWLFFILIFATTIRATSNADLSIYLLILQHPLAGIMCRCPVCFRPGVSAVKVKIGQMDKNR